MKITRLLVLLAFALGAGLRAELKLPAIIGDHMVLQQKQANPIWGWDNPGTKVTVTFAGQTHSATAGADGKWTVKLAASPPTTPQTPAIDQRHLRRDVAGRARGRSLDVLRPVQHAMVARPDLHGDLEAPAPAVGSSA
jgi:hypothetical protein